MQVTEILTDHTLMALDLQGAEDYPIRFYLDIMDQFDRAGIHWHWHPALEFNVITKGTMEYFVENEHYTLTAGQGIVKNAHLLHMAQPASHTPDAAMFSVIMDPAFLAPAGSVIYRKYIAPLLGSQGLGSLVLRPEVPWQRAMLEGLRQAYALSQAETGAYELAIHTHMCQVWQAMAEHQEELPRRALSPAQRTDQVRAKQMLTFLQTHYQERLTLDQVAQAANVSRNTCLACFRRVLGLSPMEYLLNHRLEQACHLLLTTHWPVSQVAEACGFGDASYFGKAFGKRPASPPPSTGPGSGRTHHPIQRRHPPMIQPDIRRPVVAGAGTMGTTLARIFSQHGFAVTLWNRRTPSLERAQTRIAGDLDRLAAQGLLTEDPAAIARRVTYTTDYAAFDGADFVVENIAEDLAVKQAFFRAISPRVAPEALLTTNTSGLRVTDVAQGVEDPTRFCGMHWWNPPDLMPLVEITRGDQTSQAAAQAVHALALALGKKPVIVQKDILGILGNRLQYAVMREALHILATGAAGPEEIDAAMKYGPGFRYAVLGPFETADLGGVDIFQAVSDYLFPDLNNDQRSQALHDLVDQGRLGVKAGDGFYRYAPGQGEAARQRRDALFQQLWDLLKDQ